MNLKTMLMIDIVEDGLSSDYQLLADGVLDYLLRLGVILLMVYLLMINYLIRVLENMLRIVNYWSMTKVRLRLKLRAIHINE